MPGWIFSSVIRACCVTHYLPTTSKAEVALTIVPAGPEVLVLYQKRPQRRDWYPHQNLRRSLLIQRLEGSRPTVGSGADGYGFSIRSLGGMR